MAQLSIITDDRAEDRSRHNRNIENINIYAQFNNKNSLPWKNVTLDILYVKLIIQKQWQGFGINTKTILNIIRPIK